MRTKCLLLILMMSGIAGSINSQEIYRTINGDMAITIKDKDSAILMVSNKLLVLLDYETAKINFRVGYETFQTRIDSIDRKLKTLAGNVLEFAGKIGITINARNFAPQLYNMEGALTSNVPATPVKGNGTMTCMPTGGGGMPACTLLLSFETTLASLHLSDIFYSARDTVRVDIRQSVLEKDRDKD